MNTAKPGKPGVSRRPGPCGIACQNKALIIVSANVGATSVAQVQSVNATEVAPTIGAIDGFREWPKQ